MSVDTSAPRRRNAQAPLKLTHCIGGCGRQVEYRTNNKVYCPECKTTNYREMQRRAAEQQRRKKGIVPVKGKEILCIECKKPFLRVVLRTKYCRKCASAHYAEVARQNSRAKHATREGKDYNNEWARKRRREDPSWRVNAHVRVLMHRGLRGGKAGRSWKTFVPYTIDELMRHLEKGFLRGMTWENYGSAWHIDHIQALSTFKYTSPEDPEFQAAWALSNLRPLWGPDNLKKNRTRTLLI